jgi:hypothetical protein
VNSRQPPALAVWLLKRLGVAARNEPLAGDLLEEFRNGRTAAWYWRQTFMAIAAAFGLRLHSRRLEFLALFVGWSAESVLMAACRLLLVSLRIQVAILGGAALAGLGLAMYLEYRTRSYVRARGSNLSDEDSFGLFECGLWPKVYAIGIFSMYAFMDGLNVLMGVPTDGVQTSVHLLVAIHLYGICFPLVMLALRSTAGSTRTTLPHS